MSAKLTVEITEETVRQAAFSFFTRYAGLKMLFLGGIIGLCVYGDISQHRTDTFTTLSTCAYLALLVWMALQYRRHLKRSLGRLGGKKTCSVTYGLEEKKLKATIGTETETIKWGDFTGLWRFRDYWLLRTSRTGYLILPIGTIGADDLAFIKNKIGKKG